jgi:hypothetical protein
MMGMQKKYRFIVVLLLVCPRLLMAGDKRNIPLDLFLIIDGSSTLSTVQNAVVRWLNEQVVDRTLQEGDRLTVWVAAEKGEILFSATLKGPGDKARIKRMFQSLEFTGGTANFAGVLRDATARIRQAPSLAYTLLISGSTTGSAPSLGGDAVGLLRFTRVEEYPGWRAMVIGLGLSSQVQKAASDYLQGVR